jgi:hypothetical protein
LPEPGKQQTKVQHRRRHAIAPAGVDAALELVGTPTLPDTLRAIGPLHTYALDDIPRAHADLEHNRVFGKLVGVIDPADLATTVQR